MQYPINVHTKGTIKKIVADEGANLLEILRNNGICIDSPCGGNGTCGKCAVKIKGLDGTPSDDEKRLLGAGKIDRGYRLACRINIASGLEVYAYDAAAGASIVTGGKKRDIALAPAVAKRYVELPAPSLEDQSPDLERVQERLGTERMRHVDLSLLQRLPHILKNSGYKVTLVSFNGKLAAVEPGDSTGKLYGIAVDIGTTTVAAYLYDLTNGRQAAVASMLNPQRMFGADVISRINYSMQSEENKFKLQDLARDCINGLAEQLADMAGVEFEDIYMAVLTGNTTMLHFLMGLDAANLAVSPFTPVTTGLRLFKSGELGLKMNKYGIAAVFPGVSAYVGGDTVAAILSSGMYDEDTVSLLVDIGTNGEIVLGCKDWLLACSAAAGPAFEGANIRNGMGGITGAIDSVGQAPGFRYTTIGNAKPVGICGSGIIDAIAHMLDAGIIDETGWMADGDEVCRLNPTYKETYKERIVELDGMRAFVLAGEEETGANERIVITQKDVREVQNAKAAIAAGVDTLLKHAGIEYGDIGRVYLAGGFGNNIHIESALRIGLLPKALGDRIEAIGNASGAGASEGLLSYGMLELSEKLSRKVKYVELSASAYFSEKYVDNMFF